MAVITFTFILQQSSSPFLNACCNSYIGQWLMGRYICSKISASSFFNIITVCWYPLTVSGLPNGNENNGRQRRWFEHRLSFTQATQQQTLSQKT